MTRVAGWFMCATAGVLLVVVATAAEPMTVYVLPIPDDAATLAGKSGLAPVPFTRGSVFTVTIDSGRAVVVDTRHGAVVDGLDPTAVHTVQVKVGARSFARFKFRIDENWGFGAGRKRVAIYMDSMYSNWRAWRCDKVRRCDEVQVDAGIPDASQTLKSVWDRETTVLGFKDEQLEPRNELSSGERPLMGETPQQISEPTPEDLQHLAKQRSFIEGYLADASREAYATAAGKLGLLRALLEAKVFRPDQTWELQSMGIVLGDALAQELGLRWVMVQDEYGRDPALAVPGRSVLVFPLTMVAKRVEAGQPVDVFDLFNWAAARTGALP